MNTPERILNCLEQVGIILESDTKFENVELSDVLMDSIIFIQFIVALEEEFKINFPDEYLLIDKIGSLPILSSIIESLIQ